MSNTLKSEQIEAINYDGGNILVSASAGSGKTFVMIERLIRVICSGKADISSVLAVTFTEAAAQEMKYKLKRELVKSINAGQTQLASMLNDVSTADICTLHSFCARLIRKFFFEVGVAPDFLVADQSRSDTLKAECIDKTFTEFYSKGEAGFLRLVDKFSEYRSDQKVKDTVLALFDFFGVEAKPLEFAKGFVDDSKEIFGKLQQEYYNCFKTEVAPLKQVVNGYAKDIKAGGYASGEKFVENLLALFDDLSTNGLYAIKKNENAKVKLTFERNLPDSVKQIKEQLANIRDILIKIVNEYAKHLTDETNDYKMFADTIKDVGILVKLTERFTELYSSSKREENLLDFADLEHYALRILDNPTICQSVKDKYKYVFVDEYQDVNGVQEALIGKVADDNLFMVGDAKQSIYGFRGCNPQFFTDKVNQMPKSGEKTVFLNYNFRSADAVIQLVNKIFLYSMTEEYFGIPYSKSQLVSGGLYPQEAKGRTEIHFLQKPPVVRRAKETPRVYNLLEELERVDERDTDRISALVAQIIHKELGKEFYSVKTEKFERVTFGDICILTRSRESDYVAGIVSGLVKRDIPVVSSVSQSICDIPQIQTLINVLKLIDNFSQDVPLASTLKSPVGRFTDEDLAQIVLSYQRENPRNHASFFECYKYCLNNLSDSLGERLRVFDDYFKKIRILADFCGAHDVLKRVIDQSDYQTELLAEHRGEFKVKCLNRFLAAAGDSERRLTVKEFLTLIQTKSTAFLLSPDVDEDNVRVMTMHASKGLEFPVVIVCGAEKKMRTDEDRDLFFKDRKLGIGLKWYDEANRTTSETLLRGLIKQKSREEGIREELRLFYVATTRATYSMHIVYEGTDPDKRNFLSRANCFMDYIPKGVELTLHTPESLSFEMLKKPFRQVLIGKADDKACAQISKNLNYSYPFLTETQLPLKSSVTAQLAKAYEEQGVLRYIVDEENETDIERGLTAHKIMEFFDFDSSTPLQEQVEGLIKDGVLTVEQVQKINVSRLASVVKNPELDFLKGAKLYREKGFISAINSLEVVGVNSAESVLVQGIIDLLAVKPEGAYVVDYKYSALTPESLKLKYCKQLKVYKQAVENSLDLPVKRTLIVNLLSGDIITID